MITKGLAICVDTKIKSSISTFGKPFHYCVSKDISIALSSFEGTTDEKIVMIKENSIIPCENSIQLMSPKDFYTSFPIIIVQNDITLFNGTVKLPRKRKDELEFELTFRMETDGLLHVFIEIIKPALKNKHLVTIVQPEIHDTIDETMKERGAYLHNLFRMSYKSNF